jgi:hypothetical protein
MFAGCWPNGNHSNQLMRQLLLEMTAAAAAVVTAVALPGLPGCCVKLWQPSGTGSCPAVAGWTRTGRQTGCCGLPWLAGRA